MAALLVVAIAVLCRLLASCPAKKSIRFICIAISVSRHCACVGRQIFRTARAAHGGAADRPPRHRGVSAQASRPEARLSRYRRGHPHPEIRLGRQPEHPPALSGARWGLSAHRGRTGLPGSSCAHRRGAAGVAREDHRAAHEETDPTGLSRGRGGHDLPRRPRSG